MHLSAAVLVLVLVLPGQASAANTGLRTITNLGCHLNDDTCWVNFTGDAAGPAQCRTTEARFSAGSPGGKNLLALLTGAFLSGKQVNFGVHDTTCYPANSAYPTLEWINFF
jgi:hypothetical protein